MNTKRKKIKDHELKGFKYFKAVSAMLESLHDAGCERDIAGNRILHMDQYASLLLLYMFNPICGSLRSLQQVSELKKVQKQFDAARASLGSLSEASTVFDSELLKKVIQELSTKLTNVARIPGFDNSKGILTAVDGSLIEAVGKMAWALWRSDRNGIKVHCQYEILRGVPVGIEITDANTSEKAVLASILQPNRIYVLDRGYAKYGLLQEIVNIKSSFVCRIRDNAVYKTIEDKALTAKAVKEGIVFDRTVELGGETAETKLKKIRIVAVKCNPKFRQSRTGGRGGPKQGQILLIATDRFDLESETIAAIYKHRWTIEIYFRFFKHILGCRHLISHNKNGIEIQMYMAIIACMLISLWTGRKATLRTYEMVCWYFMGMADLEELEAHIARQKLHK
ncbi:MAG: IS4 family transposase [Planctomycetes bacterium]|nr:IS4 family transposase [Planctomycetota bacterium]